MRFTGWFEDLWKQHRQDHQFLAPGQDREFSGNLPVTWREFRTWKRLWCLPRAQTEIFCLPERWHFLRSHQPGHSALPLCCLSIQVTNNPLRVLFLPSSLPSSCYCFPPSLQNVSWPQSSKSPTWSYFCVQKSPQCLSHYVCIFHSAGFSFSTVTSVPHTTYSGPHIIKNFWGFFTEI